MSGSHVDDGRGPSGRDNDGPPGRAAERRRRQRLAAVFGEVLPEQTEDDRDPGAEGSGRDQDAWLRDQVPPHHAG